MVLGSCSGLLWLGPGLLESASTDGSTLGSCRGVDVLVWKLEPDAAHLQGSSLYPRGALVLCSGVLKVPGVPLTDDEVS